MIGRLILSLFLVFTVAHACAPNAPKKKCSSVSAARSDCVTFVKTNTPTVNPDDVCGTPSVSKTSISCPTAPFTTLIAIDDAKFANARDFHCNTDRGEWEFTAIENGALIKQSAWAANFKVFCIS